MAKHRLQFDLDDVTMKEVNEFLISTGLPNRAELVRHALRFLQWTLEETKKGATLLIGKDGTLREVIFPFWIINEVRQQNENRENDSPSVSR